MVAIDAAEAAPMRRTGFLADRFTIPEDFKAFGREEVEKMFEARGGDAA